MNYESMSDFEINILVANAVNLELCEGQHYKPSAAYWQGTCKTFNPCNNPSDAWPIIVENGICIEKRSRLTDFWVAITWHQISGNEYRPIHQHSDKKPLRAAMIVFLMMSES